MRWNSTAGTLSHRLCMQVAPLLFFPGPTRMHVAQCTCHYTSRAPKAPRIESSLRSQVSACFKSFRRHLSHTCEPSATNGEQMIRLLITVLQIHKIYEQLHLTIKDVTVYIRFHIIAIQYLPSTYRFVLHKTWQTPPTLPAKNCAMLRLST